MLLILRENHIKAKYKSKTWVIPDSPPCFTELLPIELKILNDRGPGSRPLQGHRSGLFEAPQIPTDFIVSRTISEPSTPQKPCVRLPPEQSPTKSHGTPDVRRDKAQHSVDTKAKAADNVSEDMPGRKWMEGWIEKNGGQSTSHCPSAIDMGKGVVTRQSRVVMATDGGVVKQAVPASSVPLKGKTQYKVNIPQQSAKQTEKLPKDVARRHAHRSSDGSSVGSEYSGSKFGRARDRRPDYSEALDSQHYQNPLDYETFHHVPVILNPPVLSSQRHSSSWSTATSLQDPYLAIQPSESLQSVPNLHHQRYYACYEWN